MHLLPAQLPTFATRLMTERKRQGLSRSQAAAVCNVSPSFIRDAESTPERCTLGKLLLLVQGLGLALEVNGWPDETPNAHFGTPTRALSPPSEDSAS